MPPSLSDGFNINSTNLILNLTDGNQVFNSQFQGVLSSNSVISNLLSFATQGNNQLIMESGNIFNPSIAGNTNASLIGQGVQTITIDSGVISSTGMQDINFTDNVGLNHANLTPMESLVAIIAHEAFHAYSNLGFYNSQLNGNTYEARMNWMLENGFSQEIVNHY